MPLEVTNFSCCRSLLVKNNLMTKLVRMDRENKYNISKDESIEDIINKLTDEMLKYASNMEFEKAAELRDKIKELENMDKGN